MAKGIGFLAVFGLLGSSVALVQHVSSPSADAAVHDAGSATRYREIWIDHDEFGGIGGVECGFESRRWFAEPLRGCGDYPLGFDIDSLAGVTGAEIFFDIWRGRSPSNVKFRVNDSGTRNAGAGQNWSRTPALRSIDVGDLQTGANELILEETSAYHLHDAAIRLYEANGAYPSGSGITSVSPAPRNGVLTVGADETITLTANVSGADAVEFIAFYDGYDRDNDGQRVDWQSFTRNNWHPGGTRKDARAPVAGYGTIGHVGTVHSDGTVVIGGTDIANSRGGVSGNTYTIEFDTSLIPNGSPIRFKVRALNEASNDGFWVVDALGGPTGTTTLARASGEFVEYSLDPDFRDAVLHHASGGDERTRPDAITRTLSLDTSDLISATMIGNYWERPRISINPSNPSDDDCGTGGEAGRVDEDWETDDRDVTGLVRQGNNVVCYEWTGGFGQFIENPGPMFVMRRTTGTVGNTPPAVSAGGPYSGLVGVDIAVVGEAVDTEPVTVRWRKADGPGTVSFDDDRDATTTATFGQPGEYVIELTADDGTNDPVTDRATVTVDGPPDVDAGGPYAIAEAGTLTLDGSVDDPGGATSEWSTVSGPGVAAFTDASDPTTDVTFPAPGEYVLALTADDGTFVAVVDEATVTVDAAPTVDAGADTFVVLPDGLAVDGSVTDDGPVSVRWTADDASVGFVDDEVSATTATFTTAGTYELTVTADDGVNPPAADTVTVEVFDAPPPDLPPTVDAGEDLTVERPAAASLAGTVVDDGAATTTWTQVSGPGATTFADASSASTTATFSLTGTYVLRLTADDGVNDPVTDDLTVTVTGTDEPTSPPPPVGTEDVGYWLGDGDGTIYDFGDARASDAVDHSIVTLATTPDGRGPWVLTDDGVVHIRGDAQHHGDVDLGTLNPGELVAALSVLPDGSGYWVFTDRGRAIPFGAAADLEDLVDLGVSGSLLGPIVDSAATPDGLGAYLVAADGGVFAIGSATFEGSMGGVALNAAVTGIAVDPDGEGYWLVAGDGGIFAFAAAFLGSMGGQPLNAPVVGAVAFGDGYLLVAADGGLFNFSDQDFLGSLGGNPPSTAVTAVAGFPA
ncbi:MAG: hypothetical protein AAFZ07_06675 [Actinomycetota bacterium]